MPPEHGPRSLRFTVAAEDTRTTRSEGDEEREKLEKLVANERPEQIEIEFRTVRAVTISFVDAFLGRFLTEITAGTREPVLLLITGLTADTAEEVEAVLIRRKLAAATVVDGEPVLLGGDSYLKSTFAQVARRGRSSPNDVAAALNTTAQNANNRLKRLVSMGALHRYRSDPAGGGREFAYEVHNAIAPVEA